MATNWRGCVQFRENEDKRPLWQRRTNRRSPMGNATIESGSDSGAGTTTSSGGSRSSSADENRSDDRSIGKARTAQHLQAIFTNTLYHTRYDDPSVNVVVGRSSSFREAASTGLPASPPMGGYRHIGSPYSARNLPNSNRGSNASDHLTADYVPKWRSDRRFSTPAVPRFRSSVSRSPSPRFIGKKGQSQFDYFRHRAGSLPASNASLNTNATISSGSAVKKRSPRQQQDHWPQLRSPSRVEQRFLELSESADYDKIRSFVIGAKGELVERGFCYRHRSSSSSPGSTSASPNEDFRAPAGDPVALETENCNLEPACQEPSEAVARYSILVIGAGAVGKSSLLNTLKKCQQFSPDDASTMYSVDSADAGLATVVPVLICGEEVHLAFHEFCASDGQWASTQWQAAIVVYSISDKRSFSAAADVLYKIRAENPNQMGNCPSPIPITLVANKVDLERHRQVHDQDGVELARSYDCRFIDVSVELNHRVEDVLNHVMNDIWRCTVTEYRQRQMGAYDGQRDSVTDGVGGGERKTKRFSLRISKAKPVDGVAGKPRSSRARSLYTLSPGIPCALYGTTNAAAGNCHTANSRGGFLNRLFGRRAVQSCEDLFSRLLRG